MTLNLVGKLTPLARVGSVISPTICWASPLKPTKTVDFLVISFWHKPIPSRALLKMMLAELPPSTSTRRSRQLLTVKEITKPSWCSASHTSSSSKVIAIASSLCSSSDLQDLGTTDEGSPSLASLLAVEYVSPYTSDPVKITLITLTYVGVAGGMVLAGFLSKDVFPLSLSRSCKWHLLSMNATSPSSAKHSSCLGPWSWWNFHHFDGSFCASGW